MGTSYGEEGKMKMLASTFSSIIIAGASAVAQPPERPRPNGAPPPDPFLELFDTNRDGEISRDEMENAASVLRGCDKNGDGKLTRDELPRPPRPGEANEREQGEMKRPRSPRTNPDNAPAGTVIFSDGYETDPRDGGRPVVLIAAALGVKSEVFRDAFSGVRPARGRGPTDAEARANKQVLMTALGKYGISNSRLDEVSNYYRYRPESGELWTHQPAEATAIIKNGKVVGFTITNSGSGYSSPPVVTVAGYPDVRVVAEVEYGKDLRSNGRVSKLTVAK